MNILFVCTGNSCRSVMAEYVFRKLVASIGRSDVAVSSAGTFASDGSGPTGDAVAVLKEEEGVDASGHRSRPLTEELLAESDRVYVMTEAHKSWVVNLSTDAMKKVALIQQEGVPDPIGQSKEDYRQCLHHIKDGLLKILDEL